MGLVLAQPTDATDQTAAPARRRPVRLLALAAVATYATSLLPGWVGVAASVVLTAGACLLVFEALRQFPHAVHGWYAMAASFALFGLAGVAVQVAHLQGADASREAIPLNTAGFVLFAVGHLKLARDRGGSRALAELVDIVVIGGALGIAVWRVAWQPLLDETTTGGYFFLLTLVISVAIGVRVRQVAHRELRLGRYEDPGWSGVLILASYYPVMLAGAAAICGISGRLGSSWIPAAWPVAAALLILAAFQAPIDVSSRQSEVEAPVDVWRLLLLGAATPVPVIVGMLTDLNGLSGWYVFGLGILMNVLVTVRTGLAFRRIQAELAARNAAERELHQQERYDALTGLANRSLFRRRLDEAMARADADGRVLAVLYLDLDRFKVVNDSFGQRAGDQALAAIADRLRAAVREHDTAARLSGDELAVILEGLDGVEEAHEIAERIREAVRAPIPVADTQVVVGTSVGVSVYDEGIEATELLREADVALSDAKSRGRNAVVMFDASLREQIAQTLAFEHDLVDAVERGELRLHYQPQIDLATGEVCGVEALIRWQHPTQGLLAPGAFIGIAEDTGLIVPIGAWVIEEACRQHRFWQDRLGPGRVPPISVNVSPTQLARDDVAGRLQRSLATTNADAVPLHIEITEVVLLGDSDRTIEALEAIERQGVAIAVDDFGTGYFSLSHLRRFPVHRIKVDQSFVRGIGVNSEDEAIIDATIGLAHALGLTVVAEGVETREQLDYLRAKGCDVVQGYYFARPMPPGDLAAFVQDWSTTLAVPAD